MGCGLWSVGGFLVCLGIGVARPAGRGLWVRWCDGCVLVGCGRGGVGGRIVRGEAGRIMGAFKDESDGV